MGSIEEGKRREESVGELRSLLMGFGARESLTRIREEIWREGDIRERIVNLKNTKSRSVELHLIANYVYLEHATSGTMLNDLLYPNNAGGINYAMGYSDRVAVLIVGASNSTTDKDVNFIYVDGYTADPSTYERKTKDTSLDWLRTKRIEGSSVDFNVPQFIDKNLSELASKFLPSNLRKHNRPSLM